MSYSFEEIIHYLEENKPLYRKANTSFSFLVDAQLPQRLSDFLKSNGHNAIHTLELPDKNKTKDKTIKEKAHSEHLVLITKDDDFLHSFLIEKKPAKLILIKTGNISNNILMDIFSKGLSSITALLEKHALIEITREEIIVHG